MKPPSDALLARYVAGECSADEAREVERWSEEDPANHARLADFRALWEAREAPPTWDLEGRWAGLQRRIHQDRKRAPTFGRPTLFDRPRRRLTGPLAAAAVVLLAAGVTFTAIRNAPSSDAASTAAPMREYATPRGQRGTLQLPDGSQLVLAPESRLRIPADFGREVREVFLEGEALFDVVHDTTRPFRVHANGAVAEDLGTKFDVRAYPEDSAVAVAVAEGAVALGRAPEHTDGVAEGVVLRAGELGTLTPDGRMATASGSEALAPYLTWAEGRLQFVDAPLPDVLRSLGRWYDLDVRVDDPALAASAITAQFSTQSADQMLRALAIAVNAHVTRSGRLVTLSAKP